MVLSDALEHALRRGSDAHFVQITEYLNAGGDVNDVNEHGTSMLTLNLIFEGGDHLDVDMLDEDDRLRIVRLLLARGADANIRSDFGGRTPLYQACACGDRAFGLGAIRCLLEAGANIDQKRGGNDDDPRLEESPLSASLNWFRRDNVRLAEIGLSYVSLLLRYGPDLLSDTPEPERAIAAIRKSRAPIARLLMDQKVISGIGNIYRAEILWLRKLNPMTRGVDIDADDLRDLWDEMRQLLQVGVKTNAIITNGNVDMTGEEITERTNIFARDFCPTCGGAIEKSKLSGRTLYHCPKCQA